MSGFLDLNTCMWCSLLLFQEDGLVVLANRQVFGPLAGLTIIPGVPDISFFLHKYKENAII